VPSVLVGERQIGAQRQGGGKSQHPVHLSLRDYLQLRLWFPTVGLTFSGLAALLCYLTEGYGGKLCNVSEDSGMRADQYSQRDRRGNGVPIS
jgi:hypothetical protein